MKIPSKITLCHFMTITIVKGYLYNKLIFSYIRS
jgi:hypothetical protein